MARRSRRRNNFPAEPIEVQVESLNHEGRGVAHREGKVLFIDGALADETVRASYVHSRRQFDELKTIAVMRPSKLRVTPPCEVASVCGGCSLQHMDSSAQLQLKQSVLLEKMLHATGLAQTDFELLPTIASDNLGYRRKARLAVRRVERKGGVLVGFREKYSSFITDTGQCPVLHPAASALIEPLRELFGALEAGRDIPQVEVAVGEIRAGSAEIQVALVLRHLKALSGSDQAALREFARDHALLLFLQPGGPGTVHRIYPQQDGDLLSYFLPGFDLQLQFHPLDFTQVNAAVNRRIVEQAVVQLQVDAADRVLDLFCGIGNFTLPVARSAAHVTGVEGSEALVQRARDNAGLNGINNVEFHAADLCQPMQSAKWSQRGFNKVLLDPPRSGALEVIPQLRALGVQKIVYISCNPATLARDAGLLLQQGYRLNSAGVMDMFPHTTHVESMAVFSA